MQGILLKLDTSAPDKEDKKYTYQEDSLGNMLHGKWVQWSDMRREIEEEWLKDLRAFNQKNDPGAVSLSKFHADVYIGLTRTKAMSAYSRISDLMFSGTHWDIEPTPVPNRVEHENSKELDDIARRSQLMRKEMQDQMLDIGYEELIKQAALEGCILGTGCVKGIFPGVKKHEKWNFSDSEWELESEEIPYPKMDAPSIFNIYPDPFATQISDMTGLFERHPLNHAQLAEMKDDPRFDSKKIDEILMTNGNHTVLPHEQERLNLANVNNSNLSTEERYDVLEYWGMVTGDMLKTAGIECEPVGVYYANVWVCSGKTLLAKLMPMKKQRIPYNFFCYSKVPHQFWGVPPGRMMRHTQEVMNGLTRATLDAVVMSAVPMAEVNVHMLRPGQDPNKMVPGMTYLREGGDQSHPAVRFFQPQSPIGQMLNMMQLVKSYADDETALPAFDTYNESNPTAKGFSMQMAVASLPTKAVVKNLEDGLIKPFIVSLYDWNMQWNDKEEIKGDMKINVLCSSALMSKEIKSQQLLQYHNMTNNPLDRMKVDHDYLLREIAKSMEIDDKKAVPEIPPQQAGNEPSPVDLAKAELLQAQARHEMAKIDNTVAKTAETNVNAEFGAVGAAVQLLTNPGAIKVADDLLMSSGFKDHNGNPIANPVQSAAPLDALSQLNLPGNASPETKGMDFRENTSPNFPPRPPGINAPGQSMPNNPMPKMDSAFGGIENPEHTNTGENINLNG